MADQAWESFEDAFRSILAQHKDHFGLESVAPSPGKAKSESGYEYDIEVIGYAKGDNRQVLFECRREKRNLEPGDAGEFAYRIGTTGAKQGYFVTTLEKGLSAGAKLIAGHEKIGHIQLAADSTQYEYVMRFLDKVFAGLHDHLNLHDEASCKAYDKDGHPLGKDGKRL